MRHHARLILLNSEIFRVNKVHLKHQLVTDYNIVTLIMDKKRAGSLPHLYSLLSLFLSPFFNKPLSTPAEGTGV